MFPWALKLQSLPTSVEVCRPEWGDVSQIAFTLHVTTFAPYVAAYSEMKGASVKPCRLSSEAPACTLYLLLGVCCETLMQAGEKYLALIVFIICAPKIHQPRVRASPFLFYSAMF